MDQHARTPFPTVYDSNRWCLTENKALSDAAARAFDSKGNRLTRHWVDFPGRVLQGVTKAEQRQLIGLAEYAEQPLTVHTARSLLAPMIDSAVSKSEGRLDAKYSSRIDLLETSVGSLETTVTSELRSFKAEMKEVLHGATAGPPLYQQQSKGKRGWQRRYGKGKGSYGNFSAAAPAPAPAPAPYGQAWTKKPVACWECGGPHFERNCPHVVKPDAANPVTRRGAFAVSNCLTGTGEATPDETAARFGTMEAAHDFVNAVNASQEQIIVAAMSYGTDPAPAASACTAAQPALVEPVCAAVQTYQHM